LRDIIGIDIFNPRTVECIISPSPKRANQGNKGGLPIKLLECMSSGTETVISFRNNIFGRAGAFWHRPRGPCRWNRGCSQKMQDAPPPPRGGRW
jgi:hypothetical protein